MKTELEILTDAIRDLDSARWNILSPGSYLSYYAATDKIEQIIKDLEELKKLKEGAEK